MKKKDIVYYSAAGVIYLTFAVKITKIFFSVFAKGRLVSTNYCSNVNSFRVFINSRHNGYQIVPERRWVMKGKIHRVYKAVYIITKKGIVSVADGEALLVTRSMAKVEKFLESANFNTILRWESI